LLCLAPLQLHAGASKIRTNVRFFVA